MLETLKEFISKKIELLKMEAAEKTVMIVSFFAFLVVLLIVGILFIILLNIGVGLYIGHLLGNYAYGILIVAAFYLLIIIITIMARTSIKNKVANFILKSLNS
ncbi:phage holin family protein [Halpernia frigidisoli]|uniref:Putative Holin-X, holin superfamily III n=1 Tax=Halpernia frigidisoli TaxID=1125876 RepID=A0A1I3EG14_9FLAO|nr:phage holin family protein [Halpernia frigidisoli]SFH97854.1 Putative Holin-X, holin superfamily III [Halpernia frigidisoli]